MLKRRAKVVVSAIYWLGQSTTRLVSRLLGRSAGDSSLVVLYYHGVPAERRANFALQLDSVSALAEIVRPDCRGAAPLGRRRVAITFDDGLQSVCDHALPELALRNIPCTIFLPVDALGGEPAWESESEHDLHDPVITAQTAKSIVGPLVTIGAHSLSHPRLSRISREEALREIEGSKAALESLIGADVTMFAFPYGDLDAETTSICERAGFTHAFSIVPEVVDTTRRRFLTGRVAVDPSDGPVEFFLKSSGAYSWMRTYSAVKDLVIGLRKGSAGEPIQ